MIRKILSRFVTQTTPDSTPATSGSSSTPSTASSEHSYSDILEARGAVQHWMHQVLRLSELIAKYEKTLQQLEIDRRMATDLKEQGKLTLLDSDRLRDEAYLAEAKHLLKLLTGGDRWPSEARLRQADALLAVTHDLEKAWLQLQALLVVAEAEPPADFDIAELRKQVRQSEQQFQVSVIALVEFAKQQMLHGRTQ